MRSVIVAVLVFSLAVVVQSQTTLDTPVGSFTTTTTVADELGVSVTVAEVKSAITNDNFDGAESFYYANAYLSGLGEGTGLSGPDFTSFVNYFGSAAANDAFLVKAFAAQDDTPAAAAEMVEKTVMDAIPVQAILSYANEASQADWDKACALFIGDMTNSPYERANKRAANYVTYASGTEEALANQNIISACNAGPSSAGYETIKKNLQIIYTQAAIRYAFLLDIDLTSNPVLPTEDHRAEGLAFYRVVAPYVKAGNSSCDASLSAIYNIDGAFPDGAGSYYCTAVQCIPPTMGISSTELGTLENTENACTGTAQSTSPGTPNDDNDDSSAMGVKGVTQLVVGVVALLAALQ